MIQFIDFVPDIKKKFLVANEVESLESTRQRMNEWIRQNKTYEIINVETVVLPNIHGRNEEGSQDPELHFAEYQPVWYQIFRVWYR